MKELEFSRLMSDLSETANKLNKESDSLNEVIDGCEEVLRGLNVGLEVWLATPLSSERWTEEDVDRGSDEIELGFAEVRNGWHLAVREARYERGAFGRLAFHSQLSIKPLGDCTRKERIEALKLLPELVKALKAEAEAAIKTIEDAKKLLK